MLLLRDHIGIFGRMNAGKSSVMNLLTQSDTSIVDPTPGTTADTKITMIELHGLGPAKLFDTAGMDESNELGDKKKSKVLLCLKECDLVLLVIDPRIQTFETENEILNSAREQDKQIIIIVNIFNGLDYTKEIYKFDQNMPLIKFYGKICISASDPSCRQNLINFILKNYVPKNVKIDLLPFIKKDEFYILNIPMDEETPHGRYLRPQEMSEEYIARHWAFPVSYRMDLSNARSGKVQEKERFTRFLASFSKRPKLMITDSQAMDIVKDWLPEDIMLTTFSIMMVNYMSSGMLKGFVDGVKVIDNLKPNDKVLIVEACNHSRIAEDIGTSQIPKILNRKIPGLIIEHNFGREFQENANLSVYKLIIHCGGCMVTPQTMSARIRDLSHLGIPYTNYGVFLSCLHGKHCLDRVLKPWGITA
ncbi:MAG: GTPase [Lentisphaerota bacterium]